MADPSLAAVSSPTEKVVIEVHKDTDHPDKLWKKRLYKEVGEIRGLERGDLLAESTENSIRFVCISDTHGRVERSDFASTVPPGDVLLHCGDFSIRGKLDSVTDFNRFLGKLPHPIKLVIPGNHELSFDPRFDFPGAGSEEQAKASITRAKLLIDEGVEICGIKIYGIPWVPEFGTPAFGLKRGEELLEKYNLIPDDVDILMSHGPPIGIGDYTTHHKHVGCVELLNTVQKRVKPKYLLYGHIHSGFGIRSDGTTTYINASTSTTRYKPENKPIVFDYPLTPPHSRDELEAFRLQHGTQHVRLKSDSESQLVSEK